MNYKTNDERDLISKFEFEETPIGRQRPSLLLHSCCGPCSTAVIERLIPDYDVTVYFYNPNVTSEIEYQKRKEAQKLVLKKFNEGRSHENEVKYREGNYNPKAFYCCAEGLEKEPEGGKRCTNCFVLRLEQTAIDASMEKFDMFATTLTVSPHKDFEVIGSIGNTLALKYGVEFLNGNFKKAAGFQRSIELSKEYGLYRQNYCGCEFSVWDR